ncbi:hypothetical protein CDAR_592561, partial [Caerostris darwini]
QRVPTPDDAMESVAGICKTLFLFIDPGISPIPYLEPLDYTHSSLKAQQ